MHVVGEYANEKKALAENLRIARKRLHITQTEVALRIGSEKSAVSRYENGTQEPGLDMLRRLADALETTVEDLLRVEAADGSLLQTEKGKRESEMIRLIRALSPEQQDVAWVSIKAMLEGMGRTSLPSEAV